MNFHHGGHAGDVVYSIPAVVDLARRAGRRPSLFLDPQPLGWRHADRLVPLLATQPDFAAVSLFAGQPIEVDLDRFRRLPFDLSRGYLARMYNLFLPCCPDLAQPWLQATPQTGYRGAIVINRTARYRNPAIQYRFLAQYPDLLFLGLEEEYANVRAEVGPGLEWVPTTDYLEAAQIIAACRLYIGNQSACFAIAEGLKVPRVLEVCPFCPNVIPHGPGGWDVVQQPLFEQIVALLLSAG
jgi:hypothetical protein